MTEPSWPFEGAPQDERMIRLHRYWSERRRGRSFPGRSDIDPLDFAYALGRVSMVDVLRDPLRFRYRLVSSQLTEHLGYEMTGKHVDDIPETSMREFTRSFYERAVETHGALYATGTVLIERYEWWHETLVLPLAADGETIDMLLIYRNTRAPAATAPPFDPAKGFLRGGR